jgi:hypothetical protein
VREPRCTAIQTQPSCANHPICSSSTKPTSSEPLSGQELPRVIEHQWVRLGLDTPLFFASVVLHVTKAHPGRTAVPA